VVLHGFVELLSKWGSAYVIPHRHVDIDSYACGLGLVELLRDAGLRADLLIPGDLSRELQIFANNLGLGLERGDYTGPRDAVILVDVSSGSQIGELIELWSSARYRVIVDHHSTHNLRGDLMILDEGATSCSEIVALMMMELGIKPKPHVAALLIGGILSDSGRLVRARPRTFEALAWLSNFFPYSQVVNALSRSMDWPERVARVKGVLRASAYRLGDDGILCISDVGAYEASVADALIKVGCNIVLVSSEHEDELRIIGRRDQRFSISLSRLMKSVGELLMGEGGGHDSAAVLLLKRPINPKLALGKVVEFIERELNLKIRPL